MPDEITCPGCQVRLRVPDGAAGEWFQLPRCQKRIAGADVPASEPAVVPASASDGAAVTASVPRELPRPAEELRITDRPVPETERFVLPEAPEATRGAYAVAGWSVVVLVLLLGVVLGAAPNEKLIAELSLYAVPLAAVLLSGIWTARVIASREIARTLEIVVVFVVLSAFSLFALSVLFVMACGGTMALQGMK